MKRLICLMFFFPFFAFSQPPLDCVTPIDCYQVQQEKRSEAIRLEELKSQTEFRSRELQLQEEQLQELRNQRAVMEAELKLREDEKMQKEEKELNKETKTNP